MKLKLHLKAFNQKVWACMFEQYLQILVKTKSTALAGRGTLSESLSSTQSPGYQREALLWWLQSPVLSPGAASTAFFLSNAPFLLVYPVVALQEN